MTLQQAIINANLTIRLYCDCWDGSIAGHVEEPNTGTEWHVEKGSRSEAGRYYREVRYTDVPANHPVLANLPDNCWIS